MKIHLDTSANATADVYRKRNYTRCGSTRFGGQAPMYSGDFRKVNCLKCRPSLAVEPCGNPISDEYCPCDPCTVARATDYLRSKGIIS